MEQEQLPERVSRSVLRFIAAVVLHNQAVAARVGLGASDAQVLSLLIVNGPMTPSQIASLTGLSTGSVTALLDRLERGDYIRRQRDTKDRRKILVVPGEEGQQRLARHYTGYGEHMQRVLARLTPRELQTIAEFLDAMTDVDGGYIAQPPHRSDTPEVRPGRHVDGSSEGRGPPPADVVSRQPRVPRTHR